MENRGISTKIISNYHYDNDIWYTTKTDDEIILLTDKDGNRVEIYDWEIFSGTTDLLISLIRTEDLNHDTIVYESDIIPIDANASWHNSGIDINGIKAYGLAGQKIRWVGNTQ